MQQPNEMSTVTITETGSPSRSKGRGWARIGQGGAATFASTGGRTVEVSGEFEVVLGVELRRSTRTEKLSSTLRLRAVAGQSVDLSIGSPQSYDVRIDGAERV